MNKQKFYGPKETAAKLGISKRMLQYYRETGRIEGIEAGNTTLYTEEQIAAFDREKKKPGPKTSESDALALAG